MKNILLPNLLVVFPISISPYYFLTLPGVNLSIFDIILFVSLVILITNHKMINLKPLDFYAASFIFIFVALLPLMKYGYVTDHIVGVLQFIFILFVLFPFINTFLNINILLSSVSLMCIIWSIFVILQSSLIVDIQYYYGGRFIGLYGAPLQMGLISSTIIPFLLFCYSKESKRTVKILFLLGILFTIITVLATASRGAIIGLIFGVFMFVFFKYNLLNNIKSVLVLSLLLSAFIYIVYQIPFFDRNPVERIFSDENIMVRIQDYLLVIRSDSIWDFLFGVGFNNSGVFIQDIGGSHRPHNLFIALFKETGIIGLILICYILYISIVRGIVSLLKDVLKKRKINMLFVACISSSVIFIVAQQTSPVIIHRSYWLILSVCLWFSYNYKHSNLIISQNKNNYV